MTDSALLRVRDLWKRRGDERAAVRVEVPELLVHPGEFIAIRGRNGSGKSTLLDVLGLILRPDGAAEFSLRTAAGVLDLWRATSAQRSVLRRRYLSYVLQSGGLLDFLTLGENIRLGARIAGQPTAAVAAIAEDLGLTSVLDKYPGRVSGGQRQKAALARALAQRPPIALADEPTAALDVQSAAVLLACYRRLLADGAAVIMVTHDELLARRAADRVLVFATSLDGSGTLTSTLRPD